MNITPQAIILSAELDSLSSSENVLRSFDLMQWLDLSGFSFGHARGCYKGSEERSYVVLVNNQEDIDRLKHIAFNTYQQESILYKDANRQAHLVYNNGDQSHIGTMQGVAKEIATRQDAYTEMNGQYFIVA